ncbi:acetyl-CoA carboxylase biotin carboxylase subunit [Alicyclobacillaceae bacterium I2511]|nr:acetyl-CoA carboxylase biotin carboxylase subunit [Alicyclobacillaceae bacterium I2511]
MVRKLLIANRGEIARRIERTCRKMGIATVAVYSEADAGAPHVREADEAVFIGPSPVAQSYLKMDVVVQAALQTGADGVHPGYGLLSENANFAELCTQAGLTFVGPRAAAMAAMGSKVEARQLMAQAGVPVIPGSLGAVSDVLEAAAVAKSLTYPVLLKASYGGGGIGMQVMHNEDELTKAFASNQNRAQAYFGNGEMLIEKQLATPRHIEVQVLFDGYGEGVYLWERECSIQRRHQKIIEEAPSPFVDETLRQLMGETALRAARAVGYSNAGTVEFLVDENQEFYFLEMNTRLQVEHPVTELITGLDLVEWQLRLADGEHLPWRQADVHLQGHALECRIYAEDPERMLPSPGTITGLVLPEGPGIRNDVGVEVGFKVTPFYDPMIGKLIVHGHTRAESLKKMQHALAGYEISGIRSNLSLLQSIVASEAFATGNLSTDFLDRWIFNRKG